MSKVRIELNRQGVAELLKSPEMQGIINDYGQQVQNAAGDGYEAEMVTGANRVWATIKAANAHAYYSNLKHNTLLKALGSIKKS